MGFHQVPRPLSQQFRLGAFTMPVGILKLRKAPKTFVAASDPIIGANMEEWSLLDHLLSCLSQILMTPLELEVGSR